MPHDQRPYLYERKPARRLSAVLELLVFYFSSELFIIYFRLDYEKLFQAFFCFGKYLYFCCSNKFSNKMIIFHFPPMTVCFCFPPNSLHTFIFAARINQFKAPNVDAGLL